MVDPPASEGVHGQAEVDASIPTKSKPPATLSESSEQTATPEAPATPSKPPPVCTPAAQQPAKSNFEVEVDARESKAKKVAAVDASNFPVAK